MKKFFAIIAVALTLSGCAATNTGNKVIDTVTGAIAGVTNPVTGTNMYQVKNTYAIALQLAVDWRRFCWSKSYAAILADPSSKLICMNRRATLRTIILYQNRADIAIMAADDFVKNNPTISATTVISNAWNAVSIFKSFVPEVPK